VAAHLHRRKGVEHKHHHIAGPADPVRNVNGGLRGHGITIAGDVCDKQRVAAGIHAEDGDVGILCRLQTRGHLRRIDVDDDRVDLLVDHVLDAADDSGDIAFRIDDVDVPALILGGRLKALDVELRAGLGEVRGNDGNLGLCVCRAGERCECYRCSCQNQIQ
jgi:hypothetical protein